MDGVTLAGVTALLDPHRLGVLGGFAGDGGADLPEGTRTLLLIGPAEPGYWDHLRGQPEWAGPDPVDRWSRRVIGAIAGNLGAEAMFPFGGPPWHPFHAWALRTGMAWESPVRLLVHASQGLMVSFRGALALKEAMQLPVAAPFPCATCARPCLSACPVGALSAAGYDLPGCHGYLDQPEGQDCMGQGCAVRRACPLSRTYARMPDHSAYHMRQFHR